MADPVKAILSLEDLSSEYSVFERDQVLTETQLNSLARYFDDQERLARVELLGVGIAGGLRVAIVDGKVKVAKGLGLTTDGDLLLLPADTTFDHIKPYDEKAPVYAPFYSGAGDTATMLKLWELVKEGESDVSKQPLATLPGALTDYAVVMYMESYQQGHDLCSAADCDNLGVDAIHTPRMLLIAVSDAKNLLASISSLTDRARSLSVLTAERPQISGNLTTTNALADLYSLKCKNTLQGIVGKVGELHQLVPALTQEQFGRDPSVDWIQRLNAIRSKFDTSSLGVQYFYDFLKDVVETWNALRDELLDNDSVLCPDLSAFPKHLLLGSLANTRALRVGFFGSPLVGAGRTHLEHAFFLARKLDALIASFDLPTATPATEIVVTPSCSELVSLEERAIPYYYKAGGSASLLDVWNWRRTRRGTQTDITAYWANRLGGSPAAQSPLASQIGGYDFFRIEGHLGQNVDTVMDKLEKKVVDFNLPFAVRAVLLHNKIDPIKRKPKIRYNDLHRIHKLVRGQLDSELFRATEFSGAYKSSINIAANHLQFPNDQARATQADNFHGALSADAGEARKAFATTSYTNFRANTVWTGKLDNVVTKASAFKTEFGDISRTDHVTAFDSLIASNHRNWLGWLDELIDHKDKKADERLLFSVYLKTHPGVEHCAGVMRGGTFVVVYDDNAAVVADFVLPYREVEEAEPEPEEPVLHFEPPSGIRDGLIVVKPIEWRLDDLRVGISNDVKKEVEIQKNYTQFFEKSLGSLGDILGKVTGQKGTGGIVLPKTGDLYLDGMVEFLDATRLQINSSRDLLPSLAPEEASKVLEFIDGQQTLVANVAQTMTQHLVSQGVDVSAGQPGNAAIKVIGNAIATVKNETTLKGIQNGFKTIAANAPTGRTNIVPNIMQVGGLKIG